MSFLAQNSKRGVNILTTLGEMLEARGYVLVGDYVDKRAALEHNNEAALKHYTENEILMKARDNAHDMDVLVMHPSGDKLAIDTVRRYVHDYKANKHLRLLIVIQSITPAARSEITACKRFELFHEEELFRNKTKHALYAPHRGLSPEEEAKMLKKFRVAKDRLPTIRRLDDPIARYFGWEVGTVVEIRVQPAGSQEPFIYYRVVADD